MNNKETYNKCMEHLFGLGRFGIKLGLETIQGILERLDNPQDAFASIHVAGTNGKGSVASFLASILHRHGLKVGLFTSPHLVHFNERISINGTVASDDDIINAYEAVKSADTGTRNATFFEYSTAMAFYEFARKNIDIAIVETGMGGRLDATNILTPVLSIITNISIEHQQYLGNTIAEIAGEKGGIIKKRIPVVTGTGRNDGLDVIEEIAALNGAPLYALDREFRTEASSGNTFSYHGLSAKWTSLKPGLHGRHQVKNAAIALAACEVLKPFLEKSAVRLSSDILREGLLKTTWPGRIETVSANPAVILDGAHNIAAVEELAAWLSETHPPEKVTLITGILDDKPYTRMLELLIPRCSKLVLTSPDIGRRLEPEVLYNAIKHLKPDARIISDVTSAVTTTLQQASHDDVICIAGSLYVVGEAKEALDKIKNPNT